MARFWKEQSEIRGSNLDPQWNYFVHVCSFTFEFSSLEEVREYLEHFRRKFHPSSADGADSRHPNADWRKRGFMGDHWERQSRFDRLPLYLFENPKRLKVIKALERALEEWSK